MLLDTLKEEESGVHVGDDLLKTMEEIAFRSASERRERTPEKLVNTFKCRLRLSIRGGRGFRRFFLQKREA